MSQPRPVSSARPLALVTGGSSGIGRELAGQFTLHAFDLVIGGSSDRVEEAAAALRLNNAIVVPVKSDLATYDGVEGGAGHRPPAGCRRTERGHRHRRGLHRHCAGG